LPIDLIPEVPVENGSGPERLAATREWVIVFRLVETSGHVLYGEILEPPTNGRHRFVGTNGLIEAVREWLREAISQSDRPDDPWSGFGVMEDEPVG
jgi:hypothetical protein